MDVLKDFPSLSSKDDKGNSLIYFDNAATTLKPKSVINALKDVYLNACGNANRGAHYMSVRASSIMEKTRECVKDFIGAKSSSNIIFTKGATEGLNIAAFSYVFKNLNKGDSILIGIDSHHANVVPWQVICKSKGIHLNYFYVEKSGEIDYKDFLEKLKMKPKMVCFTPITNTFGVIHDYKKVISYAKEIKAKVLVDASQSMTHIKFNVEEDGIDFLVFSGHKILSPQGVGVLYAAPSVISFMDPFLYGGDMIDYVYEDSVTFKKDFEAFEGGTQNVASIFGLYEAIKYIENIGISNIVDYENKLRDYFIEKSKFEENFILYGPLDNSKRVCIFSFNIKDCHPHDVSTILDNYGIAVRSGHHCAQPFMRYMNLNSTVRASLYFYNTIEEIDYFFNKVKEVRKILKF